MVAVVQGIIQPVHHNSIQYYKDRNPLNSSTTNRSIPTTVLCTTKPRYQTPGHQHSVTPNIPPTQSKTLYQNAFRNTNPHHVPQRSQAPHRAPPICPQPHNRATARLARRRLLQEARQDQLIVSDLPDTPQTNLANTNKPDSYPSTQLSSPGPQRLPGFTMATCDYIYSRASGMASL